MQKTYPVCLCCAITLSELLKKTLKSGLTQTQREVQIEDSRKEDGGFKGIQSLA